MLHARVACLSARFGGDRRARIVRRGGLLIAGYLPLPGGRGLAPAVVGGRQKALLCRS